MQLKKGFRLRVCASVRNAFLKYALHVKGQLGYVSLGQLGSVGVNWGQAGPNGGQPKRG